MTTSIVVASAGAVLGTATGIALDFKWWELLIILVVYALVQLVVQVVIYVLKNKGIITHEQAEKLEDKAENVLPDLLDDGKLNGSNKKDNDKKGD